jgi:C4-type Zn-finger protein
MFSISDLVKLLEQIPVWKKLNAMPAEIEALRRRVEMLEASGRRTPGADECPKCHGLAYSLDRSEDDPMFGRMGVQRHYYSCKSCGYESYKQDK